MNTDTEEIKINDFVKTDKGKIGIIKDIKNEGRKTYIVRLGFRDFELTESHFKKINKIKITFVPPEQNVYGNHLTLGRADALDFIDMLNRNKIKWYFM